LKPDTKYEDVWFVLWNAQQWIETLLANSVFSSALRSSRQSANALLNALKAQTGQSFDADRILHIGDIFSITSSFGQYRVVGRSRDFSCLFCQPKGRF
jgi:hypothetical protein